MSSGKKCYSCNCKNDTALRSFLWIAGLACLVMTVLLQTKIVEIDNEVLHDAVTHAMPFLAAGCNISGTVLHLKNIRDKANITDENAKNKGWGFHVVHWLAIISCILVTVAPFFFQYGSLCSDADSFPRLLLTVILPASFVVGGGLLWLGMHALSSRAKYNHDNLTRDLKNAEVKGWVNAVKDMIETKEGNQKKIATGYQNAGKDMAETKEGNPKTIAASPTKPSANPPVSSPPVPSHIKEMESETRVIVVDELASVPTSKPQMMNELTMPAPPTMDDGFSNSDTHRESESSIPAQTAPVYKDPAEMFNKIDAAGSGTIGIDTLKGEFIKMGLDKEQAKNMTDAISGGMTEPISRKEFVSSMMQLSDQPLMKKICVVSPLRRRLAKLMV